MDDYRLRAPRGSLPSAVICGASGKRRRQVTFQVTEQQAEKLAALRQAHRLRTWAAVMRWLIDTASDPRRS